LNVVRLTLRRYCRETYHLLRQRPLRVHSTKQARQFLFICGCAGEKGGALCGLSARQGRISERHNVNKVRTYCRLHIVVRTCEMYPAGSREKSEQSPSVKIKQSLSEHGDGTSRGVLTVASATNAGRLDYCMYKEGAFRQIHPKSRCVGRFALRVTLDIRRSGEAVWTQTLPQGHTHQVVHNFQHQGGHSSSILSYSLISLTTPLTNHPLHTCRPTLTRRLLFNERRPCSVSTSKDHPQTLELYRGIFIAVYWPPLFSVHRLDLPRSEIVRAQGRWWAGNQQVS